MHIGNPLCHRMEARQLLSQEFMVGLNDVFRQFVRRQLGRVEFRSALVGQLSFQLIHYQIHRDLFALAGILQRPAALAAKIEPQTLENS